MKIFTLNIDDETLKEISRLSDAFKNAEITKGETFVELLAKGEIGCLYDAIIVKYEESSQADSLQLLAECKFKNNPKRIVYGHVPDADLKLYTYRHFGVDIHIAISPNTVAGFLDSISKNQ